MQGLLLENEDMGNQNKTVNQGISGIRLPMLPMNSYIYEYIRKHCKNGCKCVFALYTHTQGIWAILKERKKEWVKKAGSSSYLL